MFTAILISKTGKEQEARLARLDESQLPMGDVTIAVEYSSLNYKDALAITGKSPVVRQYPMVPGIDLAGTIEKSTDPHWIVGEKVLVNGFGIGETHWGGLAQKARVMGDWLLPIPAAFTPLQAMAIGTAGYTAMLAVMALERLGLSPEKGEILVTGATGGVGGIAIALLSKLGYAVVACTGRLDLSEHLRFLGADGVLDRAELSEPGRPLQKERWAGAIDCLGGHTLANVCASLKYRGVVAACGLAQGLDLPATVAPFILRGITLVGIDSVHAPMVERRQAWKRLAETMDSGKLDRMTQIIGLDEVIAKSPDFLSGQMRGRVVVDVSSS